MLAAPRHQPDPIRRLATDTAVSVEPSSGRRMGALADQFEKLLTKAPMPGTVKATRPRPGA